MQFSRLSVWFIHQHKLISMNGNPELMLMIQARMFQQHPLSIQASNFMHLKQTFLFGFKFKKGEILLKNQLSQAKVKYTSRHNNASFPLASYLINALLNILNWFCTQLLQSLHMHFQGIDIVLYAVGSHINKKLKQRRWENCRKKWSLPSKNSKWQ